MLTDCFDLGHIQSIAIGGDFVAISETMAAETVSLQQQKVIRGNFARKPTQATVSLVPDIDQQEHLVIEGGRRLEGQVMVSGAKNAAVAVIPAALLCEGVCTLNNLPMVRDVAVLGELLSELGASVECDHEHNAMSFDTRGVEETVATGELVQKMRASYYLMGAMLGRFGRCDVALPGGCNLGPRPIDQHIKGFQAMGAEVYIDEGILRARTKNGLHGADIYFDASTVGGTINMMLAAVRAQGNTTLVNANKDPQVVDTANFLNTCGAIVRGAGTDIIKIRGVQRMHGCEYTIIPDPIEAGTFMIAAAGTRGDVTVGNLIPAHMEAVSAKLMEMGARVTEGDDWIRVQAEGALRAAHVKTLHHPGFPTDLQPPISVVLSTVKGTSIVTETLFEARFKYAEELMKMGANIVLEDRIAVIQGVEKLRGATLYASDLRAGAALMVAGLIAEGRTVIHNLEYIERGYEHFEEKWQGLGGLVERSV